MRATVVQWASSRSIAGRPSSDSEVLSMVSLALAAPVLRYGLVLLIAWFGAFKFTPAEAQAIQPLVANSPLLSWLYALTDVQGASRVIGILEIAIAALIAARPLWPRLSAIGSATGAGMFLVTLSFLLTTPGTWARVDGLLVPAGAGSFIIKDLLLLGAALWTAGDALRPRHARHDSGEHVTA